MSKETSNIEEAEQSLSGAVAQNQQPNQAQKDFSSELDINLVIASFQEKLAQLTIELVVKDATIKKLTNIINNMRGQK
jgi:nucleoside diphosphate kinase